MKFNVVIGNPPFSKLNTLGNYFESSKEKNLRTPSKGQALSKRFLILANKIATDRVIMIANYSNKTYSGSINTKGSVKHIYATWGLEKITSAKKYFQNIGIEPAIFWFNKKIGFVNTDDETMPKTNVPKHNLGQYFTSVTSNLEWNIHGDKKESRILPEGKLGTYKLMFTMGKIRYTNSENLIDELDDSTINFWRVAFNKNSGSSPGIGKTEIIPPKYTVLGATIQCLLANSKKEAEKLKECLDREDSINIIKIHRRGQMSTSKKHLKYVEIPENNVKQIS